jgi:hypothetical protein
MHWLESRKWSPTIQKAASVDSLTAILHGDNPSPDMPFFINSVAVAIF